MASSAERPAGHGATAASAGSGDKMNILRLRSIFEENDRVIVVAAIEDVAAGRQRMPVLEL